MEAIKMYASLEQYPTKKGTAAQQNG